MLYKSIFFITLLIGLTGSMSIGDIGDVSAEFGDMADGRSVKERIAGIKENMAENKRIGGTKDKRAKMPPLFGGRDKESQSARRENTRHVKALHGEPGDMKIPPQERRRAIQVDGEQPKRESILKQPVDAAMSKIKMAAKNVAGQIEANLKKGHLRAAGGLESFDITDGQGNVINLDKKHFPRAKIFFIVNIASESEYTWQLAELENLYADLRSIGLQIIAFPSDSFNEEPLEDEQIQVLMKEQYDLTFPVMAKCDVNGPDTPPLWNFLKSVALGGTPKVPEWAPLEESGLTETDIQWNFDKFMVYKVRGKERVMRFPFDLGPSHLQKHIERTIEIVNENKIEL